MVPFGLASIRNAQNYLETAIVLDRWVYPLPAFGSGFQSRSIMDLLSDWPSSYSLLEDLATSIKTRDGDLSISRIRVEEAHTDTPIRYPNKLLAVGANYASHLKEMGVLPEKWDPIPFFSCPPTSSIVGPGKTVPMPSETERFDWECELTVIIGKSIRNATREDALDAIAGYTVGLDLTCRDLFQMKGPPPMTDVVRGKGQPGMKPCGPIFWPKESVGSMDDASVRLWVNGQLMMDGSTSEMIRSLEDCIVEISRVLPLDPGDMIMTGTPAGSASSHCNRWLKKGDRIKAQIGQLEPLEVEIY